MQFDHLLLSPYSSHLSLYFPKSFPFFYIFFKNNGNSFCWGNLSCTSPLIPVRGEERGSPPVPQSQDDSYKTLMLGHLYSHFIFYNHKGGAGSKHNIFFTDTKMVVRRLLRVTTQCFWYFSGSFYSREQMKSCLTNRQDKQCLSQSQNKCIRQCLIIGPTSISFWFLTGA